MMAGYFYGEVVATPIAPQVTIGHQGSAVGLAMGWKPSIGHLGLTIGAIVTIAVTHSVQKANDEIFSATAALTVVFLVSLGQGDAVGDAEHLVLATIIGGLAALVLSAPLPQHQPKPTEPNRLEQLPKS